MFRDLFYIYLKNTEISQLLHVVAVSNIWKVQGNLCFSVFV